MRLLIRVLLPLLVLAGAARVAWLTVASPVPAERRPARTVITEVEFVPLTRSDYQVRLLTRGTVRPRTESTLIPEVSGRIVEASPSLRAGAFFEADEVLLRVDPRDYAAQVTVAEAELAQSRSALAEEQARAEQARRDWRRVGEAGTPDDLVLRKPQLAGALAAVTSAEARLVKARLDLERTAIRAPYAGRVLEHVVDVGQFVSPGTVLAKVYAVDYAEVRLPLSNRQLEFVAVPELYRRDGAGTPQAAGPRVRLKAQIGSRTHVWDGRIVRAEGAIDTSSRQLFVIGQVDDPYGKGPEGRPPLKVGQFVEAEIDGRLIPDVFVIPLAALRAGGRVLLIDGEDRIHARDVQVLYSDQDNAVIGSGLEAGERLVVNALGDGMEGALVRPREAGTARGAGRPARGREGAEDGKARGEGKGKAGGGRGSRPEQAS